MSEVPLYPFAYEGPEPPTPCTPHAHISQVNPHMNAAGFQPHRVRVDLRKVRSAFKLPHAHEQPRPAPFYSRQVRSDSSTRSIDSGRRSKPQLSAYQTLPVLS